MNRWNCCRDSFLRKTTDPSAAAPCIWITFFAKSTPMMVTSFMDASLSLVTSTSRAWRIVTPWGRAASTPSLEASPRSERCGTRIGATDVRVSGAPMVWCETPVGGKQMRRVRTLAPAALALLPNYRFA